MHGMDRGFMFTVGMGMWGYGREGYESARPFMALGMKGGYRVMR